jgi:hypothetical protein
MKSIFGKKAHYYLPGEYVVRFKTRENFLKFWAKCESNSTHTNFRGQPFNWACFCRNEKMDFYPFSNSLSVKITIFEEQA